jgi:hypothetical protein
MLRTKVDGTTKKVMNVELKRKLPKRKAEIKMGTSGLAVTQKK